MLLGLTGELFLDTASQVAGTDGKNITALVKCRPYNSVLDALEMDVILDDGDPTSGEITIPTDRWSYVRVQIAAAAQDVILSVTNSGELDDFALDIEKVLIYESLTPAMYTCGDSLSVYGVTPVHNGSSVSHSYSHLYAILNRVEYKQAGSAGWNLTQIENQVHTDLTVGGETYPVILLEGGWHDCNAGTPLATMQVKAGSMITKAKAASTAGMVVFVGIRSIEFQNQTKREKAEDFNAWLVTNYDSDPEVSLVNDIGIDSTHWTVSGQAKIANKIQSLITMVGSAERWNYVETGASSVQTTTKLPMTTAMLLYRGVSSLDILGNTDVTEELSANGDGVVAGQLVQHYGDAVEANSALISAWAPTIIFSTIQSAWNAGLILLLCRVKDNGKWELGYSTNLTSITWSGVEKNYSATNGWDPTDALYLCFDNTRPTWLKQLQVWRTQASDAAILSAMNTFV
jgi:hypothetical protein